MDYWNGGINRDDPSTAGKQPGLGELGFDLLNECAHCTYQIQLGLRNWLKLGSKQAGRLCELSMYQQPTQQHRRRTLPREIRE
jgi:hypothetical protein